MSYTVKAVASIQEIGQQVWDSCAHPTGTEVDPFVGFAFLNALEQSGSVAAETGWAPYHLVLESEAQETVAVMPLYLKSHSQGEYIFDYSWADAFERAGGNYYPKFLSAVPFTPATGRRLLSRSNELNDYLSEGLRTVSEELGVSSVHLNFVDQEQWQALGKQGWLQRTHKQYHWLNQGYTDFEDFLSYLSSKKRKNIRRERRDARANDIEIELVTGSDIREHHWDSFYQFYIDTGNRKWGRPYLTREFFSLVGQHMAERILLVMCKRAGSYVAGAINFIGDSCLFGRNWGCIEDHPFLHFEVCYYQAIEYAIDHKLARVEAGAQGEHKLARGYLPTQTYSAHWIAHSGFKEAVDRFLKEERIHVTEEIDYIEQYSPFRKT